MVKDDQGRLEPSSTRIGVRHPAIMVVVFATAAAAMSLAAAFVLPRFQQNEPDGEGAPAGQAAPAAKAPELFRDWPTDRSPDVVLVLSGQQHGYLQPCGCSRPQLGGLERRYNFIESLKKRGWPVVAVDLGDVAQRSGPQSQLKYGYAMRALQIMGYSGVGIGENELAMPLMDALVQFTLQNGDKSPRVLAGNLQNKKENFPGGGKKPSMVDSWIVASGMKDAPKVGVVSVVGVKLAEKVEKEIRDPAVHFSDNGKIIADVLKEMDAEKPELSVLLYQGLPEEEEQGPDRAARAHRGARALAGRFPQFPILLCQTKEEEPSGTADRIGNSLVIGVGHKGRYVGVVGAFRTGRQDRPFDFYYQLVALGESYETPKGQEKNNPILSLLEAYTQEVKRDNYLDKYVRQKHSVQLAFPNATYVGSAKCKSCHPQEFKIWEKSGHSHALLALETAKRPALRQYDGECVVCHVVGLQYESGYRNGKDTPHLKDVGCESCHGPGSEHIKNKNNAKLHALMNPGKRQPNETEQQHKLRVDQMCQKCHDTDNDVHWDFDKKWPKVAH